MRDSTLSGLELAVADFGEAHARASVPESMVGADFIQASGEDRAKGYRHPVTFLSAIIGFVGTVLGAAIAGVVAWAIHRAQRQDVLDKERRDRNAGAASRASQALAQIKLLGDKPELPDRSDGYADPTVSDHPYDQWERQRDEQLVAFEVAVLDLDHHTVRSQLSRVRSLIFYDDAGEWSHARSADATRYSACNYGLDVIGRYRRGATEFTPIEEARPRLVEALALYLEDEG